MRAVRVLALAALIAAFGTAAFASSYLETDPTGVDPTPCSSADGSCPSPGAAPADAGPALEPDTDPDSGNLLFAEVLVADLTLPDLSMVFGSVYSDALTDLIGTGLYP